MAKNISDRDRQLIARATPKRKPTKPKRKPTKPMEPAKRAMGAGKSPGLGKTISDRDRQRMRESIMSESGKTISDRDRRLIRQLMESGQNTRLAKGPGRRMDDQSVKKDSGIQYAAKGGTTSAFGKAFAAARKKHLAGKGPATFTYKGKRYNVQTKQDRKTTVKKVQTGSRDYSERPSKAISKATAQKRRLTGDRAKITEVKSPVTRRGKKQAVVAGKVDRKGMTKEQSRALGLTGGRTKTGGNTLGTRGKPVKEMIKGRKTALAADAKKEAAKMKTAGKVVGTALLVAGPGRAAASKIVTKAAPRVRSAVKTAKDLSASVRGKTTRPSATREVRRDKKGRVSELSGKTQRTSKKIRDAISEVKKTARTTTGVGVGKGPKGTQTIRSKSGKITGNISRKTVQRGKNIRRGAGAATVVGGSAAAANARAKKKKETKRAMGGMAFKGIF